MAMTGDQFGVLCYWFQPSSPCNTFNLVTPLVLTTTVGVEALNERFALSCHCFPTKSVVKTKHIYYFKVILVLLIKTTLIRKG